MTLALLRSLAAMVAATSVSGHERDVVCRQPKPDRKPSGKDRSKVKAARKQNRRTKK